MASAETELRDMEGIRNAPRGRFTTPLERAEALYLNDTGWYQDRTCKQWTNGEAGSPCPCGRGTLQAERRPDRGSVFAQVYERYAAEKLRVVS